MHNQLIGELYNYLVSEQTYKLAVRLYPFRFFLPFLTRIILSLRGKNVLMVFGMSRSGTSMLSTFLSLGTSSFYLHEPDVELMKFRYGKGRDTNHKDFWNFINSNSQRNFKIHLNTCVVLLAALRADFRTICTKPIALLDVIPEVSKALPNAKIIYISRHPAGRSESIIRQILREQKEKPKSLATDGQDPNHSLNAGLERLGQSWGETHKMVLGWFRQNPTWHWVYFENLTNNPIVEFKKLYEKLGLTWDETIQREIEQRTTGKDGDFYEVQREASKQADKWRQVLTAEQVEAIRKGSLPFETNLYEGF